MTMNRVQPIFWAIVACLITSTPSYAQEPRRVELNAQLGIVSGLGTHGSFGGGVGMDLTRRIRGYGELSYIPLGGANSSFAGFGEADASAKAINFNVGGQYQFRRAGRVEPYAGLGLGMLHVSSSYRSSFLGVTVSGESSSNHFYVNLGGGLRYHVSERWGFRPELMIFAGSDAYVRLGGGVFYYLGR